MLSLHGTLCCMLLTPSFSKCPWSPSLSSWSDTLLKPMRCHAMRRWHRHFPCSCPYTQDDYVRPGRAAGSERSEQTNGPEACMSLVMLASRARCQSLVGSGKSRQKQHGPRRWVGQISDAVRENKGAATANTKWHQSRAKLLGERGPVLEMSATRCGLMSRGLRTIAQDGG
ncbi:hypothetical protein BDW66DRAFT_144234 [Aspergillus desertorum]